MRPPLPWDSPGKNTGVGCHFLLQCMKVKSESEVAQLCLTLSNPMVCRPPGSFVYGIFQARVLEWDAFRWSDAPSMPIFLNIFGVEILDWNFWEVPPKNWKARFSYHSFFLLWSKSQIGDATFSTELCWLGGKMTGVKWNWSFCPFHATNLRFCAPPEMVIAAMKLKDAYSLDRKLWPN